MAQVKQYFYNVLSSGGPNPYISSGGKPWEENTIIEAGKKALKVGILAPPGTKFMINHGVPIVIGCTGIYELDEDVVVTSIVADKQYEYMLNESASEDLKNSGKAAIEDAKERRDEAIEALTTTGDAYYKDLNDIEKTYRQEYNIGYKQFIQGQEGVYQLITDVNNKPVIKDIYNVIVDYILIDEGGASS